MNLLNLIQGNMVQKKGHQQKKGQARWNISKKRGAELIHKHILDIFTQSSSERIALTDLISLMNQQTNHIQFIQNKQRKTISAYINSIYGSFTKFLDDFSMYGIIREDKIYICLFESNINTELPFPRLSDWLLVNEEDYVLV